MENNDRQQRDTRQRRMVYEAAACLWNRDIHPTAEEIYDAVHERDKKVSKATVYRNLKVLADNGELWKVRLPGADRYDLAQKPHHHIRCCSCGLIIDAPVEYGTDIDNKIEEETGFLIKRHQLVFEGLCPECRKKAGDKND